VLALGYDQPLFLLAFDHRRPHLERLFGIDGDPTPAETATIVDAKSVIFAGFAQAIADGAPPGAAGILVDEQFGAAAARTARANGWITAVPAEFSGLPHFELEYGHDFAAHIEDLDPTFTKILVRYNPEGDTDDNLRSIVELQRLSHWLRTYGRRLLLELIVVPTPGQLAAVEEDSSRYVTELRPALMRRAMADLQAANIEADVWKLEGIDHRDDCVMVAEQACAGGRDRVRCVVLGQGADAERVDHWLRTAADVPGYVGFAIGRTLWWDPLTGYLAGMQSRAEAASQIAQSYRHAIDVYQGS
jgi:myo-inositol catabolism protein IolC